MNSAGVVGARVTNSFQHVTGAAISSTSRSVKRVKRAPPFSLRLTEEERAYLEGLAGNQSLGSYIRGQLLGERADKRRTLRAPKIDDKQAAALLSELGKSRLSSNLNQLAHHANMGTLDVSADVEQQLQDAYGAIIAMRDLLITALGLKL